MKIILLLSLRMIFKLSLRVRRLTRGWIEEHLLSPIKVTLIHISPSGDIASSSATELTVEQVHCQNWPDLQAPKDTSVLLDMYEMVDNLTMESPGTMMVHCSAGVGRTGAFIGLYKLIKDVNNAVS